MRLCLAGVSGKPFKAKSVALWVVEYKSQRSLRSSIFNPIQTRLFYRLEVQGVSRSLGL